MMHLGGQLWDHRSELHCTWVLHHLQHSMVVHLGHVRRVYQVLHGPVGLGGQRVRSERLCRVTVVRGDHVLRGHVTYDPTGLTQNGVAAQHMIPAYNRYATQPLTTYPLPTQAHWPMQYLVHPPHMTQVDNHGMLQVMQDPSAMQFTSVIPQLTTQMHHLQLTTPPYITGAHAYPYYSAPSIIHPLPMADNEHNSNTASPEEAYTTYPPPK
uniref:Uncharacterized protein n=1 Tax=Graphocephala atropunctata TaxID=36148 RepID=A0A1B6MR06_9HEMI